MFFFSNSGFSAVYQQEIAERITVTHGYVAETTVPEVTYTNGKSVEEEYLTLVKYLKEVTQSRDQTRRQLHETLQERDQIAQNSASAADAPTQNVVSPEFEKAV